MVDLPPVLARPVPGGVVVPFAYVRSRPFARGARRVLRLAAPPGQVVRAPCGGGVTFAGRTPAGGAVAVRCGRWSVTVTGVGSPHVAARRRVHRLAILGTASGTRVTLGVRRAGDPFGYVDPEPLLGDEGLPQGAPLGPAPRPRASGPHAVRVPRAVPAVRDAPVPRALSHPEGRREPLATPGPRAVPVPQSRSGAPSAPPAAWAGLALVALGVPAGLLGRSRTAGGRVPRRTAPRASSGLRRAG